jgi:hypothetical protein
MESLKLAPAALAILIAGCTGEIGRGMDTTGSIGGGSTGSHAGGTTNGSESATVESPSPRILRQLTLSEYQQTVADLLQLTTPDTTAIPPDVTVDGFTTNVAGAFVTEAHMDAYASVGEALAARVIAESYAKVVPCQTQDNACAGSFIDKFGLRAFRRPLTGDEKTRYLGFFDASLTGGDFKAGVEATISAMLISPFFLFRSELGADKGQGQFALTPYEVATSLAYTYWGTMPDDTLFAAAAAGGLASKQDIETQVRRLLADSRGRSRIASFFYEWTESARAYVATKDMGTYPALFSAQGGLNAIVGAMRLEQDAFVTNVVFDSTKKFTELFTADYTYANDELATYYGIPKPGTGATTAKVALGASSPRGGLLTMGMFLMGHGRTNQSSPTQRGHMIRANMLCSDVPPPPPNVDPTVQPGTPGKTGRQQIEALTGSGVCATCHSLMNPIGFGLEGFDSAAQQRTTDNGDPVDTTGEIKGFTSASGAPLTFDGPRQLSNLLATNEVAKQCLAANYYRYARGFAPKGVDTGAVDKLSDDFVRNDLDLPDLFVRVALQDSFVMRRSAESLDK